MVRSSRSIRNCVWPTTHARLSDGWSVPITNTAVCARTMKSTTPIRHLAMSIRSEEHTSELQSLMRISYAVFCLKKKNTRNKTHKRQRRRHMTLIPVTLHTVRKCLINNIHQNLNDNIEI